MRQNVQFLRARSFHVSFAVYLIFHLWICIFARSVYHSPPPYACIVYKYILFGLIHIFKLWTRRQLAPNIAIADRRRNFILLTGTTAVLFPVLPGSHPKMISLTRWWLDDTTRDVRIFEFCIHKTDLLLCSIFCRLETRWT